MGTIAEIITVAATKSNDRKASYSDYGTWVTVAAPGGDSPNYMLSTYTNFYTPNYGQISGTSQAAPVVAGLALLLKSHHPDYDRTDIFPLIVDNTDNIDAVNPSYVGLLGTGRVNVYNTLSGLTSADFTTDVSFGYPPLEVNFTDASTNVTGSEWYEFGDGAEAAGPNATHTYTQVGKFDVYYSGDGPSGMHTRRKYEEIIVLNDSLRFEESEILIGTADYMPIFLRNSVDVDSFTVTIHKEPWLPLGDLEYDSVRLGDRTSYFERIEELSVSGENGHIAFRVVADDGGGALPLEPGFGEVAKLWYHTGVLASIGIDEDVVTGTIETYTNQINSGFLAFEPLYLPGIVHIVGGQMGDVNMDGAVNPTDVVVIVNFVYKGEGYASTVNADLDCSGKINPLDVVIMVNRVYKDIPLPNPGGCP
jgi:PKD repeat protein